MGSDTRCGETQHLFVLDRGLTAKIRQDGDFTTFSICALGCGTAEGNFTGILTVFCDVVGKAIQLVAHISYCSFVVCLWCFLAR